MHCALSSFLVSQVLELSPSSSFLFTTIFWSCHKILICCSKIGQKSGGINYDTFRIGEWVNGIFWWERLAKAAPCHIMNWILIWQLQAIQFDTCKINAAIMKMRILYFELQKFWQLTSEKPNMPEKKGCPPYKINLNPLVILSYDIQTSDLFFQTNSSWKLHILKARSTQFFRKRWVCFVSVWSGGTGSAPLSKSSAHGVKEKRTVRQVVLSPDIWLLWLVPPWYTTPSNSWTFAPKLLFLPITIIESNAGNHCYWVASEK